MEISSQFTILLTRRDLALSRQEGGLEIQLPAPTQKIRLHIVENGVGDSPGGETLDPKG